MAKRASSISRVYFDEFHLSGVLNAWDLNHEQETPVVTALSDAGPRRLEGTYDFNAECLGFLEPADDGYDEQIYAALGDGSDHYLLLLPEGATEALIAYELITRLTRQPRIARTGEAILLHFSNAGSGPSSRGVLLYSAVPTGAVNSTGQNMGATVSGDTFQVVYRIIAFTGTNITLTIQESQNDGAPDAYAPITGLAETFTAIGVARDSVTIATEAWKRVAVTGTFTSATVVVTAGLITGD